MTANLDERMAELIGPADDVAPDHDTDACPVILEITPSAARVLVEGLRWALYGGAPPPDGRRALLLVLDGITAALAHP